MVLTSGRNRQKSQHYDPTKRSHAATPKMKKARQPAAEPLGLRLVNRALVLFQYGDMRRAKSAAEKVRAYNGQTGSGETFVVRDDFRKSSSLPSLTSVGLPQHQREFAKPPKESRLKSRGRRRAPRLGALPAFLVTAACTFTLGGDARRRLLLPREVGDRSTRVVIRVGDVDEVRRRVNCDLEKVCKAPVGAAK
jgi:hypothetical protein